MLVACSLRSGASLELLQKIDDCVTTESAIALLGEADLLSKAMISLGAGIEYTLRRRVPSDVEIGYVCFIDDEVLTQSGNAEDIIAGW
jgi:cobalt-precorrin-5B (C1)-methyltransferase